MAGFSLGGNQNNPPPSGEQIPFFYVGSGSQRGGGNNAAAAAADEPIPTTYTKGGFELWQHHHQQQQRQQQQPHFYSSGLGMFLDDPLAGTSATAIVTTGPHAASISGRRGGGGGMSCQDCGNQAKKDCLHMRCRTCCKSRNFQCPTHVKSTWVPAAKRRERQHQLAAALQHHRPNAPSAVEASKRPRDTLGSLAITRLPTTTSSTSGGGIEPTTAFPSEVSLSAVFRCVRVSPVDADEEQYAYQTAVSIGGHMFKGILYDQGPDYAGHHGDTSSSSPVAVPVAATAAAASTGASISVVDPSSFYPAPLSAFMAGTQFFPPSRP